MTNRIALCVITLLILSRSFNYANTYYVSTNGNDSNPGTELNPFKTIQKGVDVSNPGDTINVQNGIYSAFNLTSYGGNSESERTVIQGYSGIPVISNSGSEIELSSSKYITISGFELNGTQINIKNVSHHITIGNNIVHNARIAINLRDSHHCFIRKNTIYGSELGSRAGEVGIRIYNSDYNLIEYNDISNMFADYNNGDGIGVYSGSSYNIISHNICHDNPDDNIDGWYSGSNNIIEYNILYRAGYNENGQVSSGNGKGIKTNYESHHWIIRHNIAFNNTVGGISDEDSDGNNTFYNNTSYDNGISNYESFANNNLVFINNVSCGRNSNNSLFLPEEGNIFESSISICNSWFVDAPNGNFSLREGSRLIDAGTHLTNTVNTDYGTAIDVENARFFIDGYGITDGDLIKVGKNRPIRITDVDYTANKITVSENISWNNNDKVSLIYNGTAPDLGAYEYMLLFPPKNLRINK